MGLVCQGGDGSAFRPGTLHAELNIKSIPEWPKIADELNIPFKRIGGINLIRNKLDYGRALKSLSRSFRSSLEENAPFYISEKDFKFLQLIDGDMVYDMEPNLVEGFIGGLYDSNLAVTVPREVAYAYAENAKANGVEIRLDTEVKGVRREDGYYILETSDGVYRGRYVINAAGLYADKIADLAGLRTFSFVPLKGVMALLSREVGELIKHALVILPYLEEIPITKAIIPTVDGRVILGIYLEPSVKGDLTYDESMINRLIEIGREFIGDYISRDYIEEVVVGQMTFTNLETGWYEYVVETPLRVYNWINIVLGPAGISASPALAKKVIWILNTSELKLGMKKDFNPRRRVRVR